MLQEEGTPSFLDRTEDDIKLSEESESQASVLSEVEPFSLELTLGTDEHI